ncbi:MAG: DUF4384 domain-containing protein [Gemmatimonadetes bacterium]|nr:DUF4384 domain-containing protein [Gemmatimonadota bacterium]
MGRRHLSILAATVLLFAGAASGAEKWAMLVGVGDYLHGTRMDLQGPPNDVRMMEEMLLSKYGYDPEHIKKLVDLDATKANIVEGMENFLIAKSKPGDTVLFYFTGHGSRVPDLDGDESDGRDEVLCPTDVQPGVPGNEILDDELKALLDRIQATDVTVVLDACHSGTGTRDIDFGGISPPIEYRTVELGYPEPEGTRDIDFGLGEEDGMDMAGGGGGGTRSIGDEKAFTMIASSSSSETSASSVFYQGLTRVWSGVLTFNLLNAMKKADGETTYEQLMANVVRDVKKRNPKQTPQLEGAGDRPLFANTGGNLSSRNYLRVTRVEDGRAQLRSNSFGNELPGSIYKVLDANTGKSVGRIKITRSLGSMLDGEVIEGGDKVVAPAMAVEEFRARSDEKLHVRVADFGDQKINGAMHQRLDRMDFVQVAASDTHYFDVALNGQIDGSVVSLFSGYDITAWLEEGGMQSSSEVTSKNVDEIMGVLRPLLENAYAVKKLARMDNESPPFRVSVWVTGTPDPGKKQEKFVEMKIGDPVYFHFHSDKDAYLTLLNVDSQGAITILFPNEYMPFNRVVAGKTYSIPTPEMGFEMHLGGAGGQEMVKAFATEFPMDLSALNAQAVGGFRSLDMDLDQPDPFGPSVVDKLSQAITGSMYDNAPSGTRAIMLSAAPKKEGPPPGTPTENWSTDYLIIQAR